MTAEQEREAVAKNGVRARLAYWLVLRATRIYPPLASELVDTTCKALAGHHLSRNPDNPQNEG